MDSDGELLARLRSGDEQAFAVLVGRYHEPMLRLAASFVPGRAVAEEVVQDTWLAALRGLESFGGRSSLKTWLFLCAAESPGGAPTSSRAMTAATPTTRPC